MRIPFFPAALLLAAGLCGQGLVSPAHFTAAGGNYFPIFGFQSGKTPSVIQQVHDDLAGKAMTVKRLSFRRGWYDTNDFASFSIKADVSLSTAAVNHAGARADFNSNHGPDRQTAAQGVTFSFPPVPYRRIPPVPFTYLLPLAKPFLFAGKGPLCWQIDVASRTNTKSYPFDGFYQGDAMYYACRYYSGTGCRAAGATSPMTIGQNHVLGPQTGNLNYSAADGPPSRPALFTIGRSTTAYAGVPLPFALPGTAGGPSGVCTLYTDLLVLLPAPTDAYGRMSTSWIGVPLAPYLHGVSLHSQALAADPQANALGLVASDLASTTFRAPFAVPPVAVVYQEGGPASRIRLYTGRGLIVRFD